MESDPARYPELRFLNEFEEILKTRNRLPHWHQNRSTYFITFRLGDSLPANLLETWRVERDQWLAEHPKPWAAETEQEYHKRFSTRLDRHLDDGHGCCLLREPENREIVASALLHFNRQRYLLHSHVIMPNHVHLLVSLAEAVTLDRVVGSWKRFTSTAIHRQDGNSGALWQKDYFDRIIRDWDHFANVARYIRRNPIKAKLGDDGYLLEEAPWIQRLLA
jgi:REP element-mobilizing transposase RayT